MNLFTPWDEMYKRVIWNYHRPEEWAVIFELRLGTGYGGYWTETKIDAFALNCYPSKGNHKIAYEIKTSRADFLSEIKKPLKRHPALMFSNQFFFVTPPGLIKIEELPQEAGLVEIDMEDYHIKVKAPYREAYPPVWPLLASIARRLDRREREKFLG